MTQQGRHARHQPPVAFGVRDTSGTATQGDPSATRFSSAYIRAHCGSYLR